MRAASLLALLLTAAFAGPLQAGPPPQGMEAAEGGFFIHVDYDAAVGSRWLRDSMDVVMSSAHVRQMLERVPPELEFLHAARLHGVTFVSHGEDDSAAVIDIEADRRQVLAALAAAPGYRRSQCRGVTLHRTCVDVWTARLAPGRRQPPLESASYDDAEQVFVGWSPQWIVVGSRAETVAQLLLRLKDAESPADSAAEQRLVLQYSSRQDEPGSEPCLRSLEVLAGDQLRVRCDFEFDTPIGAQTAAAQCHPDKLVPLLGPMFKTERQPPAERIKQRNKPTPAKPPQDQAAANKGRHGKILLGANLSGVRWDRDQDRIKGMLSSALRSRCVGRHLHVGWESQAQMRYSLSYDGRHQVHRFIAELSLPEQLAAQPGEKPAR